jgi:hypothetical protein
VSPNAVGTLAWVCLFGGALAASFGWFVRVGNSLVGDAFLVAGGVAMLAGIALIVVRSRMKDTP